MRTSGPPWSGRAAGHCVPTLGTELADVAGRLARVALLAGWLATAAAPARAQAEPPLPVLPAPLTKVVDGDTIQVQLASGPLKVRLHGIDAPESGQAGSPAATKALRAYLEGADLEIEPVEQDRYGRMVAIVLADGQDVNARMVDAGYAWAYRQYLRRRTADEHYCQLEARARDARRGLWTGAPGGWEPPWEWRARGQGASLPATDWGAETAARCVAAIGRPARASAPPATAAGAGDCRIKGNINGRGERIYHVPGSPGYTATRIDARRGERWFCSVGEAEAAGWRAPRQ